MRSRGQQRDFGRRKPRIEPRYTVYIICEGEKTEYKYFKAIRQKLHLTNVQVKVEPGTRSGSDPKNLIEYAKSKKVEDEYDDAWCVFDDDGRPYIDQVLQDAPKLPSINVAFSNPCFELWYYLHYDYSTGSYNQNQMVQRLKVHMNNYSKDYDIFAQLPDKAVAIKRAEDLRQHHASAGHKPTNNPSTSVDKLVGLLYSLDKS